MRKWTQPTPLSPGMPAGTLESAWKERDLCHQYFVRKIIVPLAGQSDIFFSPKKSPKILLEFF